jgi:hypothetical protein
MKFLLFTLLILGFVACKRDDQADLSIKMEFCSRLVSENERLFEWSKAEAAEHTAPMYREVEKDLNNVASWRESYLKRRTKQNLFNYSDSIVKRCKKIAGIDPVVIDGIDRNRKKLTHSNDTSSVLNLFYWTLSAELAVNETLGKDIFPGDWIITKIPSYTNAESYLLGDTVLITVQGENSFLRSGGKLDFSKVECVDSVKNAKIIPNVYRTGPIYILTYRPKERGSYVVRGRVIINNEDRVGGSLHMYQQFDVK